MYNILCLGGLIMNEIEEKIKKIIDSLSKEEIMELKRQIRRISYYVPSGDSVDIAEHIRGMHYDEKRKEEVLRKLKRYE